MTSPVTPPKRKLLTLGPGSLTIGEIGTDLDMSCQLTNVAVQWSVDAEDAEATLCGGSVGGARNYTANLAGTVFQDVELDGVVDFTWKHKGVEAPFKFVPDNEGSAVVTGRVTIDPIDLGGDVRTRPKSEFEWQCVGDPTFAHDPTEGGTPAVEGATG